MAFIVVGEVMRLSVLLALAEQCTLVPGAASMRRVARHPAGLDRS
jgi:hypothetical protein